MPEEKIFEVRIVNVKQISPIARDMVTSQVAKWSEEKRKGYQGFAKVTFVTASPPKIASIEPIVGTIVDYTKTIKGSGDFSVF